jgi:hypothetical protein
MAAISAAFLLAAPGVASAQNQPMEKDKARETERKRQVKQAPKNRAERTATFRNAKPMPLPRVEPGSLRRAAPPPSPAGAPGAPRPAVEKTAAAQPGPRASGDVQTRPLRWAGKLFFSANGDGASCSAQFIAPRVLLTAAHCVRDAASGAWHDDITFYLKFDRGYYDGEYPAYCTLTKAGWVQDSNDRYMYDYALIVVDDDSATGNMGLHFNYRVNQYARATSIGYPAAIRGGEVIQTVHGPVTASIFEGVLRLAHGDRPPRQGSSGGAWVGKYSRNQGNVNYAISVNSFNLGDDNTVMYGPYLGEEFRSLLEEAEAIAAGLFDC